MNTIPQFYLSKLIISDQFFSKSPVRLTSLLYPEFLNKCNNAFAEFIKKYPSHIPWFVETYRSQALAASYAKAGSGIKHSMHHYGIAGDLGFKVNGIHTYNGNYDYLRKCLKDQGLHLLTGNDIGHVQFIPVSGQDKLRAEVLKAVKDFQKRNGLTPDGIVGVKTITKAKEVFTEKKTKFHTVKSGETLSVISKEYYGNMKDYIKIFEANRNILTSPNQIRVGQKLIIPQ